MVKNRKVNDYLLLLLLLLLCFFEIFFTRTVPALAPTTHTRDPRLLVATRDPRHLATLHKIGCREVEDMVAKAKYIRKRAKFSQK